MIWDGLWVGRLIFVSFIFYIGGVGSGVGVFFGGELGLVSFRFRFCCVV